MIFELSRDYARAWELIQQGEKLACWVDWKQQRYIARAEKWQLNNGTFITNNGNVYYVWMVDEDNTFDLFDKRCTELNIEFYLPLADSSLMIG